jgi:Ni,Fe-hydrogenase III large subunit
MEESNYIEQSHKWELLESSLKYILRNGNELQESINYIHDLDRDISETELKEFEKIIDIMSRELQKTRHLINVRWTRF